MRNRSHRFWLCIAAAVAVSAIAVAAASADFKSVNDPIGDTTKCGGPKPCADFRRRNADIVSATAGHDGPLLKHTIRVVGHAPAAGYLKLNTDSDPGCEWVMNIPHLGEISPDIGPCAGEPNASPPFGHAFVRRNPSGDPSSPLGVHETVITFKVKGSLSGYGWKYETSSGGISDHVPNGGGYIRHRLG